MLSKPLSATAFVALLGLTALLPREAEAQYERMRDSVCVYEHADYRGREECYRSGESIRDLGNRRDNISSIRIRGRARITLFEHPNFGGRSIQVDEDVADLRRLGGWNDEVDSLRVSGEGRDGGNWEPPPWDRDRDRGDRVCVYEHSGFGGDSQCFSAGDDVRDLRSIGWNDRISSIRVFGRSRLAGYEHTYYSGEDLYADRDIPDLSRVGWNDRISSLRIGGDRGDRRRHRRD